MKNAASCRNFGQDAIVERPPAFQAGGYSFGILLRKKGNTCPSSFVSFCALTTYLIRGGEKINKKSRCQAVPFNVPMGIPGDIKSSFFFY